MMPRPMKPMVVGHESSCAIRELCRFKMVSCYVGDDIEMGVIAGEIPARNFLHRSEMKSIAGPERISRKEIEHRLEVTLIQFNDFKMREVAEEFQRGDDTWIEFSQHLALLCP